MQRFFLTNMAGFETRRLSVWHWSRMDQDATCRQAIEAFLPELLTDEVLHDLPPSFALTTPSEWIADRRAESAVYCVEAEGLIGLLILSEAEPGTVHLGYLLAQAAWRRGYATELLKGLLAALSPIGEVTLLAGVARGNPASGRVLEKVGFVEMNAKDQSETRTYRFAIPEAT